jgi:xylulose-5-phosphate/fructose-6-phosphate phosphoketolase
MLILRTPKVWTGPKVVDGVAIEGTFRRTRIPLAEARTNPEHVRPQSRLVWREQNVTIFFA